MSLHSHNIGHGITPAPSAAAILLRSFPWLDNRSTLLLAHFESKSRHLKYPLRLRYGTGESIALAMSSVR